MIKKKYLFIGDNDSINVELISKSFSKLKKNIKYILIGSVSILKKELDNINSKIGVNEIQNPFDFDNLDKHRLNIFNLYDSKKPKYLNILNQINFSNFLANYTKFDLVTMPINKSIIKNHIKFNGITEYLGNINNTKTIMLMLGDRFSVIPITTHINLKDVSKNLHSTLDSFFKNFQKIYKKNTYLKSFKRFNFLCINPHCSEYGTLGVEDFVFKKFISKLNVEKKTLLASDSAFNKLKKKTLFISLYHDQALTPFKILNKNSVNCTLGLNYKRLSPAHGTATDIKYKNIAKNDSYIKCMKI